MVTLLGSVRDQAGSMEALVARWGVGEDVVAALQDHLLE